MPNGPLQPQPAHQDAMTGDIFYRIGSQVHDHEARMRLLEANSIRHSETITRHRDILDELCERFERIENLLLEHIRQENKDRAKLIAASVGQFLAVIIGVIAILAH